MNWRTSPHARAAAVAMGSAVLVAALLGLTAALVAAPSLGTSTSVGTPSGAVGGLTASAAPTPAATVTLTAAGETPAAVSLAWTATDSLFFSEYEIQISSTGATGPFTTIGEVTTQSTVAYSAGGLSPGATYWWRVVSVATIGGDTTSNVLAVLQPSVAYFWNSAVTSTSATLNWTNNATYGGLLSFTSYVIYQSTDGGAYGVAATISNVATLSDTLTDLSSGTPYSFYLATTDCLNCSAGTPSSSVTQSNTITLGTVLSLSASVSESRSVADVGQPVLLTCTPSGGESPFTFAWSLNGSSLAAGNASMSVTYSGSGSFLETCQITDHLGSQSEAATTITIYADVTAALIPNRTSADAGQYIWYNCTVAGGVQPITADVSNGDGGGVSGTPVTTGDDEVGFDYNTPGTFIPTCTVTDGDGFTAVSSVAVTIDVDVGVSAQPSTYDAAPGYTVHFSATASNGSGTYPYYNWTFGDGGKAAGATVEHDYTTAGSFTANLTVTDSNGGSATSHWTMDISALSVVSSYATTVTQGSSLEFQATGSGGAGAPYNYTWHFGDGTVGYGAIAHHTYATPGTYDPTVTVRDSLGENQTFSGSAVSVAAPPPALSWLPILVLVLIAALVGLMVGVVMHRRAREEAAADGAGLAGWVPPVGPRGAVEGMKKCPKCGAANPSTRHSCQNCGARLGRT
jgi:PKD repeat protein